MYRTRRTFRRRYARRGSYRPIRRFYRRRRTLRGKKRISKNIIQTVFKEETVLKFTYNETTPDSNVQEFRISVNDLLKSSQKTTLDSFRFYKLRAVKFVFRPVIKMSVDAGVSNADSAPPLYPNIATVWERSPNETYNSFPDVEDTNNSIVRRPNAP